ncbi:MAG TPA: hypothetical protein VND23_05630 [Acidimicrobiales bacterium]|nr:hypothetical protein [Acidimicrobiales bacterium]
MSILATVNLWSPHQGLPLGMVVLTAFLLGVVHATAPDEHTWPITFSYVIGSFSGRRGMRSALAFSVSFTLLACPALRARLPRPVEGRPQPNLERGHLGGRAQGIRATAR